ncbi:hypothetical protein MPSEU_000181300 [Mayamaea pseudoterrestris]|nr:hypothetical protein MPSEU_000181300 [Mayamaea pseudoterrestris]
MSSSSASFHRKVLCSSLGVVLGAWAFYMTQKLIVEPEFVSIGKTCSNHGADSDVDDDQLHAYEPLLGFKVLEPFVCLMTQFMHQLVESHPAGLLTWGTTMMIALPAICLMLVEAG